MKINRLAAIDIGSNSVRLLITDVLNHQGKITYNKVSLIRVPVKLGEDAFSLGYITKQKQEKLANLLQTYTSFINLNEVERWRICATSALREANNAEEVLETVWEKVGCNIEIINSNAEAYFIFLNYLEEQGEGEKTYVIADVGGGCTEIAVCEPNKEIITGSFRLGTLRILNKEEEKSETGKMNDWLRALDINPRKMELMGSGGNINKLNSLFRKRGKISRTDFVNYYKKLRDMNWEERLLNVQMNSNRAQVIVPAMRIYLHIMRTLKVNDIKIPGTGLADGIVKDLYHKNHSSLNSENNNCNQNEKPIKRMDETKEKTAIR